MEKYHDLFVASTGAAAAFIGLLFVAISIAPENVFGAVARREKSIRAQRAFIALGNVFFISLIALVPDVDPKSFAVIAIITLVQILRDVVRSIRDEPGLVNWHNWGLLSAAVYVLEIYEGQRVEKSPLGLVYTVCGLYFYSLLSAWMLLRSKTEGAAAESETA